MKSPTWPLWMGPSGRSRWDGVIAYPVTPSVLVFPFVLSVHWAFRYPMDDRWLSIYLRDHHAASAGGVALARRAMGPSHPIAKKIARDRGTLEAMMRQLGVAPSALKVGLVRMAELLGRLKLNGRLLRRSPLSHVLELEMLVVGIRGKEALWTSLLTAGLSFQGIDLDALVESARTQATEVEELRLSAAANTFGHVDGVHQVRRS